MDLNSIVNAVTGNTELAVAMNVLKKAQDTASKQMTTLINSLPKASPSMPGVGQKIDVVG
ncbi:MAG: YjfB family protein [Fibrobacterota bacterium]